MSFVIADSGGTKTDWFVAPETFFTSSGLNPNTFTPKRLAEVLRREVAPRLSRSGIRAVFFYGAGCTAPPDWFRGVLQTFFGSAKLEIQGDLLAAARATSDASPALIGLLGTGAHAGYFDGQQIRREAMNLGYLLGDEGSGADLGKETLRAYLYGTLPQVIHETFIRQFGTLSREEVVTALYHEPHPNRWLAQFAALPVRHPENAFCQNLIEERLRLFFRYHLAPLQTADPLSVSWAGGLAAALKSPLNKLMQEYKWPSGDIVARPLPGLVHHHKKSLFPR